MTITCVLIFAFAEAMSTSECSHRHKCSSLHTSTASARTCTMWTIPAPQYHMGFWMHTWWGWWCIIVHMSLACSGVVPQGSSPRGCPPGVIPQGSSPQGSFPQESSLRPTRGIVKCMERSWLLPPEVGNFVSPWLDFSQQNNFPVISLVACCKFFHPNSLILKQTLEFPPTQGQTT